MAGALDNILKGGSTGMSLGGPTGAAIGAGLGIATSAIQGIQAARLKKKAEAAMPELVDPNQAAFLSELNQKRRSIETGADFAGAMDNIDATTAGTQEAITRNTGGDVGGTIQALLQAQQTGNMAKNAAIGQGQQQQMQANSMYGNLLNQIAARRFSLQQQQSQQALAEWGQKKQTSNQNAMAGVTGAAGILGQMKPSSDGGGGGGGPEQMASLDPGALPTTGTPEVSPGAAFPELMGSASSGQLDLGGLDLGGLMSLGK